MLRPILNMTTRDEGAAARGFRLNSLEQIPVGRTARITDVPGADELSLRLLEMGLTPGTGVTIVGTAPLGDPLEVEVRGYRLSLRRREAALVNVAP